MSSTPQEAVTQPYNFFRVHYQNFLIMLTLLILLLIALCGFVLYQVTHRPLPVFTATAPNGKQLVLVASPEPNYMPSTVTRWASRAAVTAYTYDFANTAKQLAAARPFFTPAGWINFQNSLAGLLATIKQNQLFVNGVVVGAPVIVNQGDFTGNGYSWRIQLPFLVTTQSAETTSQQNFTVSLTVVKVPTSENPTGIGIDQFIMS